MSNVFIESSDGLTAETITYFQLPKFIIKNRILEKLTPSEKELYLALCFYAQETSKVEFELPPKQLQELVTMAPNSVTEARRGLVKKKLIRLGDPNRLGVRTYHLCDHRGLPLLPVSEQRIIQATKRQLEGGGSEPLKQREPGKRDVFHLTRKECKDYYEARLKRQFFGDSDWYTTACPFHGDEHPSFTVNLLTGNWRCYVCPPRNEGESNLFGGILDFEKRLSNCDTRSAIKSIADLAHAPDVYWGKQTVKPEIVYVYTDEHGNVLYRFHRRPGKDFSRGYTHVVDGRVIGNLDGVRLVPYNLPAVITASTVLIAEGEKDCDNLNALGLLDEQGKPVAATCNPFGALCWKDEYSWFLRDKRVIILPDCDDDPKNEYGCGGIGQAHGVEVYNSAIPYASEVQMIEFKYCDFDDDSLDGGDVSDFLALHGPAALIERIDKVASGWVRLGTMSPVQSTELSYATVGSSFAFNSLEQV